MGKRSNWDIGPISVGRNTTSDIASVRGKSARHLYRSARLSIGGCAPSTDRSRVGWFYANVHKVDYDFQKYGIWTFGLSLHSRRGWTLVISLAIPTGNRK